MARSGGSGLFGAVISIGLSAMVSIAVIAIMTIILGDFTIDSSYAYASLLNTILDLTPLFTGIILFAAMGLSMMRLTGSKL